MAFRKSHDYHNVFKKVKIDISEELHCEDVYVVFQEPKTEQAMALRGATTEDEGVKAFKELLPQVLIDHNFFEDETETKKLSNEEVVQILFDAFGAFQKVLTEYTSAVFRVSKS